jgi:hypothetical protein
MRAYHRVAGSPRRETHRKGRAYIHTHPGFVRGWPYPFCPSFSLFGSGCPVQLRVPVRGRRVLCVVGWRREVGRCAGEVGIGTGAGGEGAERKGGKGQVTGKEAGIRTRIGSGWSALGRQWRGRGAGRRRGRCCMVSVRVWVSSLIAPFAIFLPSSASFARSFAILTYAQQASTGHPAR